MTSKTPMTLAILGGGASGVILANHLLQAISPDLDVVLIERHASAGLGLAYGTHQPEHILNVQAARMSALETAPGDFVDWLEKNIAPSRPDLGALYMPRMSYGAYLQDIVARHKADPRFRVLHAQCIAATPDSEGVTLGFDAHADLRVDYAILATGHDHTPSPAFPHSVKLGNAKDRLPPYEGNTVIVGTGLSMIDAWLELESRDQPGIVHAVSRRGLTPLSHAPTQPFQFDERDIPFHAPLSQVLRWLRTRAHRHQAAGGDWRDVMDGLRPFTQRLWKSLSDEHKTRFLRHAKPYWDVHRHRLAPQLRQRLHAAVKQGRVRLHAARIASISASDNGFEMVLKPRGQAETQTILAGRIYDCSGIIRNLAQSPNPLIRDLIAKGLAAPADVPIGLALNDDDALVGSEGIISPRLFAVGPLARASYFEIDSVPDIRPQCARLAQFILSAQKR